MKWFVESHTTRCFGLSIKYVMISQHGPLSLYTNYTIGSLYPMVRPWDDFQGPLAYNGHNSCSVCKATLC